MLEVPRASGLVEGCVIGEGTGCMQPMNFPGSQRTKVDKESSTKARNHSRVA